MEKCGSARTFFALDGRQVLIVSPQFMRAEGLDDF